MYFETYSGIAGDMVIGSLLDMGADKQKLIDAISSLNIEGDYELKFGRKIKNGIDAYDFDVVLPEERGDQGHEHGEHHHSHSHHHGNQGDESRCFHEHDCHFDHGYEHNHDHSHQEHHNDHHYHSHHHGHTNYQKVCEIIDSGDFSDYVKENAKNIFKIIAKAEAKAHGIPIDQVHFHEVGAVDSIIDIVGTCVLMEDLNVEEAYFTQLYEGRGIARCAHGNMPVPVPAVLNICQEHDLKINIIDETGEHITPTGAAIVANFTNKKNLTSFTPERVGLGAGDKNFEKTTNILRVMEIQEESDQYLEIIETNVDDTTPEVLGYCMERLSQIALDVFYTPIYMKKNRPAYKLSVLCTKEKEEQVTNTIFKHTTTLGVRKYGVQRSTLERKIQTFNYKDVQLSVKVVTFDSQTYVYPEYESAKKMSDIMNLPIKQSYDIIREVYKKTFNI